MEDKFDSVKNTILQYPDQLQQAWDEIKELEIPEDLKDIDNVSVHGMGGSALGARMVDALVYDNVKVPVEIFNQYELPNYADAKTLVIISSYSGNTEEIVSCLHDALDKGTKIFVITTNGKIKEILDEKKLTGYVIDPRHNPSGQPRMSIGYAVGAILALFSNLEIADLDQKMIKNAVNSMRKYSQRFAQDSEENEAKQLANKLKGRFPVLIASEHLYGCVYTVKNQFNESAKTFSALFELPELNHHLMEGLKNPDKNKEVMHFVFFNSNLYRQRIQRRYDLTKDVVSKNEIEHTEYAADASTRIEQLFEVLTFGSFVVYYLTEMYGIDPTAIPWVDYFKKQLKD